MDNDVRELVNAIGAMAETLGVFRCALLNNGFTKEEAFILSKEYLHTMLTNKNNKEDN